MHKREAIAIADHVFAFEPTDSYALQGKVNGYGAMGDLKTAELHFAKPGSDSQRPRFQELAAETPSPFNQDKDRSKLELENFQNTLELIRLEVAARLPRRADMKYPG